MFTNKQPTTILLFSLVIVISFQACYVSELFSLSFLQEEAERWKERGNRLSKGSNLVDLAIAYYSLALKFTPPKEKDLKATILSNRSLMYKKTGRDEDALKDAQMCVDNNPKWAKVRELHLKLGLENPTDLLKGKKRSLVKTFLKELWLSVCNLCLENGSLF